MDLCCAIGSLALRGYPGSAVPVTHACRKDTVIHAQPSGTEVTSVGRHSLSWPHSLLSACGIYLYIRSGTALMHLRMPLLARPRQYAKLPRSG